MIAPGTPGAIAGDTDGIEQDHWTI